MTGTFITFEGPDGAGKTTQVALLAEALAARGYEVVRTREPGGTRISDQIRGILLNPEHTEMADAAEVLLYAASRAQHVAERIAPALAAGKIVLCDRFVDASIAYQAYGLGVDPAVVRAVNAFAAAGLRPHRTYMLDLPPDKSAERLLARAGSGAAHGLDRIERKREDYHRRVRDAFLRIAGEEPERVRVVDADAPPQRIHGQILDDCNRLLATVRRT